MDGGEESASDGMTQTITKGGAAAVRHETPPRQGALPTTYARSDPNASVARYAVLMLLNDPAGYVNEFHVGLL